MKKKDCGCNHKLKVDIPTKKIGTSHPRLKIGKNNPFTGSFG